MTPKFEYDSSDGERPFEMYTNENVNTKSQNATVIRVFQEHVSTRSCFPPKWQVLHFKKGN